MQELETIQIDEPLTTDRIQELWSLTYNRDGKPDWSHLFPRYSDDIVFEDSIQRIEGKQEFIALCNRLSNRCEQLHMDLSSIVMDSHTVYFSMENGHDVQKMAQHPSLWMHKTND